MVVDFLRLTREIYVLSGTITRQKTRTDWKRRVLTSFIISSMFAFNLHGFCNGCTIAGLHKECISHTIVFFVVHIQTLFKLNVLLMERGEKMIAVFKFIDGYVFVDKNYSKQIYVSGFFIILFTLLAYAVFPMALHRLPFFYETVWGSSTFMTFSVTYLTVNIDLFLIFFVTLSNEFTFLQCADALCCRLGYVKSWLESIKGTQDEEVLVKAIKEHQSILRTLNNLADVVSINFFTQIFATLSIVIFSSFAALKTGFLHFSAVLSSFVDLLLYCWLGQMITNTTEALHFASYNNQWYNCNKNMKMNLKIVSLYTRKPFEIKGLSIIKMNLQTFKEVLTDSYSYLMLLLTMTDE